MENYDAKFLCSYGGEIQRHPNDTKISYVGGHNKILYVDRGIDFATMLAELSALSGTADIAFKYQLPGDEHDALISVTGDNDLHNMMLEYDNLYRDSPKTPRMRLFIFPGNRFDLDSNPASTETLTPKKTVKQNSKVNGGAVVVLPPPPVDVKTERTDCSDLTRLSSLLPGAKYDVFISFRGEDTRRGFLSHLCKALSRKQVETFVDFRVQKGSEISAALLRAIEESFVSVVVFSENYASSKWCLEELVKIMDCYKENGRVVVPVFYNITPSRVRKQLRSYNEEVKKHLQNNSMKKVQKWREALAEAANLAGWDSSSCRDESELIQKIVKDVLQKLIDHNPPNGIKSLVGIDRNLEDIDSLLGEVLEVKTRMIGIWGVGGIGKTTLAKLVFERYSYQYEGSCFLENVRERSEKYGEELYELRNELYSELLQENNCKDSTRKSTNVERRLRNKRIFVVLDDVSSSEQLKYLVGERQHYGPGSKIIITARDKSVLAQWVEDEEIYKMKVLNSEDSLTLFCLNAFNQHHPRKGHENLSQEVVKYCEGLPLALKILGSFLRSKSKTEWDSALQNIKKIPGVPILNALKLTYDELNYEEREIFLDIACFFKGLLKEHVISLLGSCGFDAANGMRSLLDKSLIAISHNSVTMHDLIHEMALEIVREESIKNPENRSRLWDYNDIRDVLRNNKGTDAIESIMLDMSRIDDLNLSADTFKKMSRLRLLKLYVSSEKDGKLSNLQLPIGLKPLRYFEWHAYPLSTLPSNFCPENLVTLRIQNSQLKRLWDGKQNLMNLEEVDLTGCQKLVELPDLSKANNLKTLRLSNCISLPHVHPSILSLGKLELLDLLNCMKLEMLGNKNHSRSLKHLYVDGCSNLIEFALSSEEIEYLDLSHTGIKVLDSSIGRFTKVKEISLCGLRLENLPTGLSRLKSLEKLSLFECGRVVSKQKLHDIFEGLQSLQNLSLVNCDSLFELPGNVSRLSSLQKLQLDGSNVETLPASIKHLSNLESLSLMGCKMLQYLPELPPSIRHLKALNCSLLQTVQFSLFSFGLQEEKRINISLQNCVNLDVENCIYPFLQYVRKLAYECEFRRRGVGRENVVVWRSDLFKICYPDSRVPEWFTYRAAGSSITFEVAPPSSYYFGSLLCLVLSSHSSDFELDIKCRCFLEDGNMHKYSLGILFLNHIPVKGDSDHVYMAYNFSGIFDVDKLDQLNNKIASSGHKPKLTFEFFVSSGMARGKKDLNLLIKECGVYPLNDT
ncbi:hypothetical protein PIB30_003141 [Stylosanthes scabra]|uniref:TIR domain-containing protein n=1 Tax=Stylosanthes scabra TaxID=79078 RepID=A0ABU6Z131_9FABA|nr:hypothetical protein [Stylosanthes scabra]